jgi:predicted nucleotidyltransferase
MVSTGAITIDFPKDELANFCQRHRVQRLALFGSVVSNEFRPDSDVDVLVTFTPDAQVGFLRLSRMQRELTELLGYPVDLVPECGLKSLIRDEVLSGSQVIYEA